MMQAAKCSKADASSIRPNRLLTAPPSRTFQKKRLAGAVIALTLLTATVSGVRAETFAITGTVGFETGMRKLATITLVRDVGVAINWGDGTDLQTGWVVDCGGFLARTCDIYGTHRYTTLGNKTISIHYKSPGFFPTNETETTTATILPIGDFVILSIGDSVGSGEGNPVVARDRVFDDLRDPIGYGLWDDPGSNYFYPDGHADDGACNRSRLGGPALAARQLLSVNPASNITFIHVACSGAKINQGPVESVVNQLTKARGRIEAARRAQGGDPAGPPINIDALLISAGANNIAGGFGTLVSSCLTPGSDCSTDAALQVTIDESFDDLPGNYLALASAIANGPVSDVYIAEYFDPTRDEDGNFPSQARSNACAAGLIDPAEWEFLYNEMVVPLNLAVGNAASEHGWHLVSGIAQDFREHGYCAQPGPFALTGDSWVVKAPQSVDQQGDQNGTAHPNLLGQMNYYGHIRSSIVSFTPPRTTASATADGQPYSFGTWTAKDVTVSLAAVNPISESGVSASYFAVDNPACTPEAVSNCLPYTGSFVISDSGDHAVSFFSVNLFGAFEAVKTANVRIDKDPPVMTCTATPPQLWPPNGKMVPVRVSVQAVDEVSGPAPFTLTSVGTTEGDPAADIQGFSLGTPDTTGSLRARRLGTGPGRDYGLTYESSDHLGNTGNCTVVIPVPHDQGRIK